MVNTVLAVDIGTSSLKAGLITANGEDVFVWRQKYNFSNSYKVAQRWFISLQKAVEKMNQFYAAGKISVHDEINVVAISVSGNGPTLVSEDGTTLKWNEEITDSVQKRIKNGEITEEAAKSLFVPRILSFMEKYPDAYRNSKYIFSGPEFLVYKLTGKAVTILPEARYTGAYWTKTVLEENNIDAAKFPDFMMVGQQYGVLSKESAELLCGNLETAPFVKLNAGIPVYGAGPDFIAALIGTGTIRAGELCDRSGSSEGINFCVDKPIFAEGIRTLPSVVPGLWNISVLIPDSSKLSEEKRLETVEEGIKLLKRISYENGIKFPKVMKVTGGQTNDKVFLQKKSNRLGLKLLISHCKHSELLGDAKVVWENYENL